MTVLTLTSCETVYRKINKLSTNNTHNLLSLTVEHLLVSLSAFK